MDDPVLKHRREQAEQGIEQTPAEVQAWFDDASELFRVVGIDVPPEDLVDAVDELKGKLTPPESGHHPESGHK